MASNRQFKHPRIAQPDPAQSVEPGKSDAVLRQLDECKCISWNNLPIVIRKIISPAELQKFIESVLIMCSDADDITAYLPEYMDYGIRYYTVLFYTNVVMPDDFLTSYKIIYETDLYDVIRANISNNQISALEEVIKTYVMKQR